MYDEPKHARFGRGRAPQVARPVRVVEGRVLGPELLNTRELVNLLGVHRITLWKYRQRGLLPSVLIGGELRYPRDGVEKLFQKLQGAPAA